MADVQSSGGWVEVIAPGVNFRIGRGTMPHALVSEANGTFTFKRLEWADREAGDDATCPFPSFVGQQINDVFFTRNRLGLLTGENVVMSRAGGSFFNFFRETATQVLDTDPIDIAATEKDLAILMAAVPFNEDIVIFAPKTQFRFTSENEMFGPKTVQMKPTSKFDNSPGCVPVSAGTSIYFTVDRQKSTGVMEYAVDANSNTADALEITEHVPRYLPPGVHKIVVCTSERILLALSRTDPGAIYTFSYYARGQERLQSAWSRWAFEPGASILDVGVFGTEAVLLIQRADGVHLEAMRLPSGRNDGNADHVIHLDRRLTELQTTMSYNALNGVTTVTLPYSHDVGMGRLEVWERFETAPSVRMPRRIHHARLSPTQINLPGDMRTSKFFIGVVNESVYEFSEQFLRNDGAARTDGRLQLRRMSAQYARTGAFVAEVRSSSRDLSDSVSLDALQATLWAGLRRFENSPVKSPGVTLYLSGTPGFSDTGPLSGRFAGVIPDGRFYARCSSDTGSVRSDIGADGTFYFGSIPTGVKAVDLVRTRDNAVVHSQLFGQEGSGGNLLAGIGSLFLVAPDMGLAVAVASGAGALLRTWDTLGEENADLAAAQNGRYFLAAQSKAVLAAVTMGQPDWAARWLRPMAALMNGEGRVPTEADARTLSAVGTDRARMTQLWFALALASFVKTFPAHAYAAEAKAKLQTVMNYLDSRLGSAGTLSGLLLSDGGLATSQENMVGYFVYLNAATALANASYGTKAATMAQAIDRVFWQPANGRYASQASSAGVMAEDVSLAPNFLAPLFAMRYGSSNRATLHRAWFDYFEATDGSAKGYAVASSGLTQMGDPAVGMGGVVGEQTFHAVLSKAALGDRAGARLDVAQMAPLVGDLGLRNVGFEGAMRPWYSAAGTAMAICALNPNVVFGVGGSPLWAEGPQVASRNQPFRYVFHGSKPTDEGRFDWPVSANSENAKVTLRSWGALPFAILSANWEGYFTARAQKV